MKQLTQFEEMMMAAHQVEKDVAVVKEIYDRWPNIRVKYLDPDYLADVHDKPFMICEVDERGNEHIIFTCDALDGRVLEQLKRNDQANVDLEAIFERETQKMEREEASRRAEADAITQDLVEVGIRHFNKGKMKYRWTDEFGDKKVVG